MKRISPEYVTHESSNKAVLELMESVNVNFIVKLDDALEKRGVNQKWLSETTGLRPATISDFIKGNKTSLSKIHLMLIMSVLRISDMTELIDIEFKPETIEKFKIESEKWINDGIIPQEIQILHRENTKG